MQCGGSNQESYLLTYLIYSQYYIGRLNSFLGRQHFSEVIYLALKYFSVHQTLTLTIGSCHEKKIQLFVSLERIKTQLVILGKAYISIHSPASSDIRSFFFRAYNSIVLCCRGGARAISAQNALKV